MKWDRVSARAMAALLVLLCAVFFFAGAYAEDAKALDTYDKNAPLALTNADIIGKSAIVADASSGTVLFDKRSDRQMFPASTTKIMTCLLALERSNLSDIVTIPASAENLAWDESRVPVNRGEQITMEDLLYGLMMKSGNDAAIAIAEHVAGSISAFADMMNERAAQIGCKNTHFVNPHGLHDEEHYTTAYDLMLIAREAMKNQTFREIVACRSYTMAATNRREKLRLETSNPMFVSSAENYYPDLIGVKTGYHSNAGYCFVGAAARDGVTLISVTLKTERGGRWTDTARLMDYGFARFQRYSFSELYELAPVYASVSGAAHDDPDGGLLKLTLVPGDLTRYGISAMPEQKDAMAKAVAARITVSYNGTPTAPIQEGDILGTLTLDAGGAPISATVIASRDVRGEPSGSTFNLNGLAGGFLSGQTLMLIGIALLVIVALIVVVALRRAAVARRRKRELERRARARARARERERM